MMKLKEYTEIFKRGQRVKSKVTGGEGTVMSVSPFSVRVIWDDYKNTMQKSQKTPSSIPYTMDKAIKLFEPVLDEYSTNVYPDFGNSVMGTIGDASFIGPEGERKGAAKKPIYKTPKSSIHYKKGKFAIDPDFDEKDNYDQEESSKSYGDDRYFPKNSIHNPKNISKNEQLGMPVGADGIIDGGPRSMDPIAGKKTKKKNFADSDKYGYPKNEIKDYNDQVVPKSSVHYGERDKVKGEPKMKFEKVVKAAFVPDEMKNLKAQGDWKSNLNKAVMDLTPEAEVTEPVTPVPTKTFGETPDFPMTKEDGTKVIPIPGMGLATKNGETDWTFGDTPKMAGTDTQIDTSVLPGIAGAQGASCASGHQVGNSIDLPCDKKPLIKKFLMLLKKEQSNLHEGIPLKGIYEGKVVKLNSVMEGDVRKFKSFVKEGNKIYKINFGPKPGEGCSK